MLQKQQYARLTFSESITTPQQMYKGLFKIAFRSFGNQNSQLDRQYQWLSETQFKEIVNLCWALPGPTVLQVIITMVTLKTKSPLAGFIAFLVFNIPAWVMLLILGRLSNQYVGEYETLPTQLKLLFLGFNAAGAGVMVRSFSQNLIQHYKQPEKLFIILSTAAIFLTFRSVNAITFCLIFGSVLSLYTQIQTKKKMSQKSQNLMRQSKFNWIFGKTSIYILIIIYLVFWIYFTMNPDSAYIYSFVNYFAGIFIIGPLNTIFAYFFANFSELHLMTQNQFWLGVPLAFIIPGSIINVGIYFSAIMDGIIGAILAAIFLYLPCFLSIYGILPQWRYYRDKPGVQRLTIGLTCVTTGFVLSIIILSLQHCIKVDLSITICIFIVSVFLNYVWGVYSVITILIAGLLANTRRWGLIYYRMLPDHQYI